MREIELLAPGKVNLFLEVLFKRMDGYHEIFTVLQTISLYDRVAIKREGRTIEVKCNLTSLENEENIVYKAVEIFCNEVGIREGVKIYVEKSIPVGGGCGGGSSDAGVVLKGLNTLYGGVVGEGKLMELGEKLGMDVPFFIKGGTALASGRGEKLEFIQRSGDVFFILLCPPISISTGEAYNILNLGLTREKPDIKILGERLKKFTPDAVAGVLFNRFESVLFERYPLLRDIKMRLLRAGALAVALTGTGSCLYGIARDREDAENMLEEVMCNGWVEKGWVVQSV